ncbi:hypothetical protein LshimejAT787_1800550 [Lyophyllum shimeji]|uniref:Uncharacterized protein n=1 Tax=Lyophyllum shimeji TaxID=47721 RepID=A0A9P3Q046_LYOSH|nr:hypothetical protein LshimejAT787_1800550 [Lyophyllum shimeji]
MRVDDYVSYPNSLAGLVRMPIYQYRSWAPSSHFSLSRLIGGRVHDLFVCRIFTHPQTLSFLLSHLPRLRNRDDDAVPNSTRGPEWYEGQGDTQAARQQVLPKPIWVVSNAVGETESHSTTAPDS